MLGKVVLRYLDGMDEPLINRCPYHEELRSTACSVALVVLWMGLHQEKFPLLATTLQAAAGVSGPQKWALILPSSARVSLVIFFLLYAAWVRSRAERPSVSYTKAVMEVAWTGHNLQLTKTN